MASRGTVITCDDFLQFQDVLKTMRIIDDKIIYALNTTVPTKSFKGQVDPTETCKGLYQVLTEAHQHRDQTIKSCISEVSKHVKECRAARDKDPDDLQAIKHLRNTQARLRLMQAELNIEEVVKDTSLKVFHEKCRNHYVPQSFRATGV